jgi:hypothetical protein
MVKVYRGREGVLELLIGDISRRGAALHTLPVWDSSLYISVSCLVWRVDEAIVEPMGGCLVGTMSLDVVWIVVALR